MTGKQKCKILKEIRAEIAKQNDITLVIEECTHKGECRGTCPCCESEVRYLEAELEKRRSLRKTVALAGISAGMTMALSGCAVMDAIVDSPVGEALINALNPGSANSGWETIEGEIPYEFELMGDVAYVPDLTDAVDSASPAGETPDAP
ncbi:MAG: hypothetical protein IJ048_10200 [Clostridia bacterium]|nr:hypothetical protein [Clostridia bacterium]